MFYSAECSVGLDGHQLHGGRQAECNCVRALHTTIVGQLVGSGTLEGGQTRPFSMQNTTNICNLARRRQNVGQKWGSAWCNCVDRHGHDTEGGRPESKGHGPDHLLDKYPPHQYHPRFRFSQPRPDPPSSSASRALARSRLSFLLPLYLHHPALCHLAPT